MTSVKSNMNDFGVLFLRLSLAALMLVHGLPKLTKLFAGEPIQFADPIGLGMAVSLGLAVFSEVFCSLAIAIGFKTRITSAFLAITMFIAAFVVHSSDSWSVKEKAVLYLCGYIVLIFTGGGKYSVNK
jgi:putative oxidoreductase